MAVRVDLRKRSRSSRCSSDESCCFLLGSVGSNYSYADVFPEPTSCNAAQCPIHQRYDPSQHQVRFFSDGTPPPIPEKRLARTLSLPVTHVPPLSPLPPPSPLQNQPHNFDNPLYMLAPIHDIYLQEEAEEFNPSSEGLSPSLSPSQLSFDTPDEHLPHIFGSFDDQRVISQGIQHCHLVFLRSMAQSMEAGMLRQREGTAGDVRSYQPGDFLLCEGTEPKQIGDTDYYSVQSPKLPGRVLGLRVQKQFDEASFVHTTHQPPHVNVREVIAHFQPGHTLMTDSSYLQPQDPFCVIKSDCTAAKPPGGGSTEPAADCRNMNVLSVQSFLQKGCSVSIERDLPHTTLKEFVQESCSLQREDCLDYDRQVCVLLLQVLTGFQHLCNISGTAADLRPQGIFLVWPKTDKNERNKDTPGVKTKDVELRKKRGKGKIQKAWRVYGSPCVVLTPLSSAVSVSHPLIHIKSEINVLIQYCLTSQESSVSSYRTGLLHLSSLLQREHSTIQVAGMVVMLQTLLWGPPVPLFSHRDHLNTAVYNWLILKRALLVMKFAERGLIQDQSVLDWEDYMCLQYVSFTDPEVIVSMASQLWLN
ncbi:inactive tyrosine-protein kinase PRAG1 isoform X2 [Halichoeres trimaculatus]|uniref:inactive tyrosine-protein kinase PRAG1 isoform X2 n=1 Tax=Halichoeres trimaculatus TaxID=147232 RepID=UPI003D9F61A1